MGWFSSVVSRVASAASVVASVAVDVGRAAGRAAKVVACKAIDFMAHEAEKIVGQVKKWWPTVRPYVQAAPAVLRKAATKVATKHPVGAAALGGLATAITALLALENSPVLKKVDSAIARVAQVARDLEQQIKDGKFAFLSPAEYEAAVKSRTIFRAAEANVAPEQRAAFDIASALNDFGIARNDLRATIEAGPQDFEHYLRLRATQKLLKIEEDRLITHGLAEGLTEDDWFLVRVAGDLVKADPELQASAAERLDRVLLEQHGKTLQSFIYEELVASWKKRADALEKELEAATLALAGTRNNLRRLQVAKSIQAEMDPVEAEALAALEAALPQQEAGYRKLRTEKEDVERYADAAEGFLQMLEKTPEQLEREDRAYVLDEGANVGAIIVKAAEQDIEFAALEDHEQSLVTDFANIFQAEARARMAAVLEVTA